MRFTDHFGNPKGLLVPTVLVINAILNGALDVPKVYVLLNPIVFLIIGVPCRKLAF